MVCARLETPDLLPDKATLCCHNKLLSSIDRILTASVI